MTENNASTIEDQIIPIDGQDAPVEGSAETQEVEQELFDYPDIADKVVKIQVNGEEIAIPLKEALAGYQRQADYTKKTQELSEQKKRLTYAEALSEALLKDPAQTIQLLGQQYGVNKPSAEEQEWIDPSDQKMSNLEKRIAAFEAQKAADDLTRTIDSLQSKYGEDFNADEVVAKALATGQTDLEAIFKQITFDRVYSKASDANKKLADEQGRLDAKRKAGVVTGGTSSKASVQPAKAQPKTVFEAFEAAKKDLNA